MTGIHVTLLRILLTLCLLAIRDGMPLPSLPVPDVKAVIGFQIDPGGSHMPVIQTIEFGGIPEAQRGSVI